MTCRTSKPVALLASVMALVAPAANGDTQPLNRPVQLDAERLDRVVSALSNAAAIDPDYPKLLELNRRLEEVRRSAAALELARIRKVNFDAMRAAVRDGHDALDRAERELNMEGTKLAELERAAQGTEAASNLPMVGNLPIVGSIELNDTYTQLVRASLFRGSDLAPDASELDQLRSRLSSLEKRAAELETRRRNLFSAALAKVEDARTQLEQRTSALRANWASIDKTQSIMLDPAMERQFERGVAVADALKVDPRRLETARADFGRLRGRLRDMENDRLRDANQLGEAIETVVGDARRERQALNDYLDRIAGEIAANPGTAPEVKLPPDVLASYRSALSALQQLNPTDDRLSDLRESLNRIESRAGEVAKRREDTRRELLTGRLARAAAEMAKLEQAIAAEEARLNGPGLPTDRFVLPDAARSAFSSAFSLARSVDEQASDVVALKNRFDAVMQREKELSDQRNKILTERVGEALATAERGLPVLTKRLEELEAAAQTLELDLSEPIVMNAEIASSVDAAIKAAEAVNASQDRLSPLRTQFQQVSQRYVALEQSRGDNYRNFMRGIQLARRQLPILAAAIASMEQVLNRRDQLDRAFEFPTAAAQEFDRAISSLERLQPGATELRELRAEKSALDRRLNELNEQRERLRAVVTPDAAPPMIAPSAGPIDFSAAATTLDELDRFLKVAERNVEAARGMGESRAKAALLRYKRDAEQLRQTVTKASASDPQVAKIISTLDEYDRRAQKVEFKLR